VVTAYITLGQGNKRRFIVLRLSVKTHKVFVMGCFDIAQQKVFAAPIFGAIQEAWMAITGAEQ